MKRSISKNQALASAFSDLGPKEQKAIVFLYEWDRPVRLGDMRNYIDFPHSTLNSVVKRLKFKELVIWEEYGTVILTPLGKKLAAHHLKHHLIIHHYFYNALGLSEQEAHEEGMKVAGVLSCQTVKTMLEKIPDCDLQRCGLFFTAPKSETLIEG